MSQSLHDLKRIVQHANLATSPDEQTRRIVDAVCTTVNADICSLYVVDAENNLRLLASHGLKIDQTLVIPAGAGLVGLVARSHSPVNLENASLHPAYHHVPGSNEERYPGFCGVPVVNKGVTIGVLVVQRKEQLKLGELEEAFIETLAAHLALMLTSNTLPRMQKETANIRMPGVTGSPGIGIGRAWIASPAQLSDVVVEQCTDVASEIADWRKLLQTTTETITEEISFLNTLVATDTTAIFDAYSMLLQDQTLIQHVEAQIRAGYRLTAALKISIAHFSGLFLAMDDPYLRARHEDIGHLGNKLYSTWLSDQQTHTSQIEIEGPVVLAGRALSISDLVSLPSGQLNGVVCFDGSALSHTAVLANALGIPAVMGIGDQQSIQHGETLIVDGNGATVIRQPNRFLLEGYRETLGNYKALEKSLSKLKDLPAQTQDGTRIQLLANTGLQADLLPGIASGAEGIGLYRTEIPFLIRQNLPTEEEQVRVYKTVLAAYPDSPVYIRTLDVGSDKPLSYLPAAREANPALGLRGIRFTLDNIQLLTTQIRALLRAATDRADVHILFPMVSATVELDTVLGVLTAALSKLSEEGYTVVKPKIGVMIEVPAAITLLPFWASKIDFVSVGTNDLSQYVLALDRSNPLVANLYDAVHPAVLYEIDRVMQWASKTKLPVCICGEMATDPVSVLLLLGMGVRKLSMSASRIPLIKSLVRLVSLDIASEFRRSTELMDNPGDIRILGNQLLDQIGFQHNPVQNQRHP